MPSVIANCACKNEFQDRRYGAGRRVHNTLKKDGLCCTSCGKGAASRQAEWKKYRIRKAV